MPLEVVLIAAAAVGLTFFLWQPLLVPRAAAGAVPLGFSWCAAPGTAGLQIVVPLLRSAGALWCARATLAYQGGTIHASLGLYRREAR